MTKNQKQAFKNYLLAKGFSSSSTKQHLNQAIFFEIWAADENLALESTSYSDILHFIQTRKTSVSQKTISIQVNSLRHFFNFLDLPKNPTSQVSIKGIKRRKLYHILKPQELEQLYESFEIPEKTATNQNQNWLKAQLLSAKRNRVMLGLMIWQGLTATELLRLTEKDLHLREGKIFIAGTRRSNERILKLESAQIMDLMEYSLQVRNEILELVKTNLKTERLFMGIRGSKNFSGMMQKFMQSLKAQSQKLTGSKVDSAKQIRTSVITGWLKQHNLRRVQYMAGHRFVSSTESYLVNDLDGLSEDIEKFHPF